MDEIEKKAQEGLQRCCKEVWVLIGEICEEDPELWVVAGNKLMDTMKELAMLDKMRKFPNTAD